MNHHREAKGLCLVLVAMLVLPPVTATLAAAEDGGASPEEVFERFRTAASEKDYPEMAACMTPESRMQISSMMLMVASMTAAFSQMGEEMAADLAEGTDQPAPEPSVDLAAKLEALLARHGLDDSVMDEAAAEDTEPPAQLGTPEFFADIMTFVDELPNDAEDEGEASPGMTIPTGSLTNLAIDGDTASAQIGEEPVQFIRVGGRWFLDLDLGM